MKKYLLPKEGQFYKANLHCHSTVSDGCLTPAELKEVYKKQGYSIIAYTDHEVLIAHPELRDEHFLPLNGYEIGGFNEKNPGNKPYTKLCHICFVALEPDNLKQVYWHREKYTTGNAINYKEKVQYHEEHLDVEREYTPEFISGLMKEARDKGFFVTYNHPTWSMEEYTEYCNYHGMHAMEIYNHGSWVTGHQEYNDHAYDAMLRGGERIYCVSTDDNHNRYPENSPHWDSCGGFTVIKADKLEYRTITRALENGHFYASQGPEIKELWFEDGTVHVKCSPAASVTFNYGTRRAQKVYADADGMLEYASAKVPDVPWGYVRVTVTDEKGKVANSSAYFADDLMKDE